MANIRHFSFFYFVCVTSIFWSGLLTKGGDTNNEACSLQLDNNGNVVNNGENGSCLSDIAEAESSVESSILLDETNEDNGPKSDEFERISEETETPQMKSNKEMSVTFKNKSDKKVKLFWKGFDGEKVLQTIMDSPSETIMNTFYGHEFFFTAFENEDEVLYSVRMENHIDFVELLTKEEMLKRDEKFEKEKNEFMKNYYSKTGKRWKNYYPRDAVSHFMYDVQNIGQVFKPMTNATKFDACPNELMTNNEKFQSILKNLEEKENEYKMNEFENLNKERIENEETKYKDDRNYFHHVPVYKAFEEVYNDNGEYNLRIVRYNGTVYCQDLNVLNEVYEMEVLCNEPRALSVGSFLSSMECDHIIELGHYLGTRRSTVSESAIKSLDRTSSTVWVERKFSPIVDNIVKRIGNILKIDESLLYINGSSESLQFVHYLDGELYRPHVDYGTDLPNNRFITFLMYLNDVTEGGNTSFPSANKECKNENDYFGIHPKKGNAAWFYDLFEDGNVDSTSLHFAEPPTNGSYKYMTNLWIWDPFFK